MRELSVDEIKNVKGGELSWGEGATMILALGAAGGPVTFAFAAPIALAMYIVSP